MFIHLSYDIIWEIFQKSRPREQTILSQIFLPYDPRFNISLITKIPFEYRTLFNPAYTGLTELNIRNMTRITDDMLARLTNLKILDISGPDCNISDKALIPLTKLVKLGCALNGKFRAIPEVMTGLVRLENISLDRGQFKRLVPMPNLRQIWIPEHYYFAKRSYQQTDSLKIHTRYTITTYDEWRITADLIYPVELSITESNLRQLIINRPSKMTYDWYADVFKSFNYRYSYDCYLLHYSIDDIVRDYHNKLKSS